MSGRPGSTASGASIFHNVAAMPSAAMGRLIQNTARQPNASVSSPPSGGPAMGPSIAGMVSQAIAVSSSSLRTRRRMSRRPTGTIIAPPKPWRMRAATSSGSDGARPHSADAEAKIAMAATKTRFAPQRSAIQPLTGMNTASATR